MNICIQKYNPMKREPNPDNEVISIRIRGAEAMRFYNLFMAVFAINKRIDKSDIIRELIGLDAPDLLTIADIDYFRSGKKSEEKAITNGNRIPLIEAATDVEKKKKKVG